MIKKILIALSLTISAHISNAQSTTLPVKELSSAAQTPFVFYITGDGGFNSFSTDLCTEINNAGYPVTSLNAKSYFWDKKTPEQTVTDISTYIESQLKKRKNQQIVLAGYSFGADVMPFIVNRLPDSVKKKLISVVLLSPSASTDFEIHFSDMFGTPKKRAMDVVAEINKMGTQKTAIILGDDEDGFPEKDILLKTVVIKSLAGGHHYDGNTAEVAKAMMLYFK